jgi:hypothetical protein
LLSTGNWFPFSLPNVTHAFSHLWVFRAPVMIYVSKSASMIRRDNHHNSTHPPYPPFSSLPYSL